MENTNQFEEWLMNNNIDGFQTIEGIPNAVYDQIRRIAAQRISKERRNHTLQPTALVNEFFLRIMENPNIKIKDKQHFVSLASKIMRNILIDYARKRKSRGYDLYDQYADDPNYAKNQMPLDKTIAVHQALEKLEKFDEFLSKIVELKFFVGLTNKQISEVFAVSESKIGRDLKTAQSFLETEI